MFKMIKHYSNILFHSCYLCRKGKRKEKDSPTPIQDEYKAYLEDDYVKEKIIDTDLDRLVNIPSGLERSEWLATHSKYYTYYNKNK